MKKILVSNNKGGTGKTTISVHLACASGNTGRKVLLVDTDINQADALRWVLKLNNDDAGKFKVDKVYKTEFENVSVIPTDNSDIIKSIKGYDLVVIDSDPDVEGWAKFLDISDMVLIVFAGYMSVDDAVEVIADAKRGNKKMVGIINKATQSYLGTKMYLEAKKLHIDMFPMLIRRTTSFEKAYKGRKLAWKVAKAYADLEEMFSLLAEQV